MEFPDLIMNESEQRNLWKERWRNMSYLQSTMILSVMRSREVSVSIILQNLAQLKALFEKQWESIMGNCVRPEVVSAL